MFGRFQGSIEGVVVSGELSAEGRQPGFPAGFGWTEGRAGLNEYSGLIQVFKVNKEAAATSTTAAETRAQTTTLKATTQPPATTTTTQPQEPQTTSTQAEQQNAGQNGNALGLILLFVLGLIILVAAGLLFLRGKKRPEKKEGKTSLSKPR